MANTVRAALLQTDWTGDKESMIDKHEEQARAAAAQGAQVMCFQELFYGPYFCQVQEPEHFDLAEPIPDGPTTQKMMALAKETGVRAVRAILENVLLDILYELPEEGSRKKFELTPEVIRGEASLLSFPEKKGPKRESA